MYAAVERGIQIGKRLSYVLIPVAVIGACEVSHQDSMIEPESYNSGPETIMLDNDAVRSAVPEPAAEQPSVAVVDAASAPPGACPSGMLLVQGSSCSNPEQPCAEWKDDPSQTQFARCARFAEPSICKGQRSELRFCIDKLEAGDSSGMPIADVSWTQASAACQAAGKRLCKEHEWIFACEGEQMRPYPYGFTRDPSLCNFEISEGLATKTGELADKRQPVTSNPNCSSPFGVMNMVGTIDEWVMLDRPHYSQANGGRKMMSGLKGGWWAPLRNRCRPVTLDHDEFFHELQTGFRCCADAN